MSDIEIFKNMPNDDEFIEWIDENPNGFVLNIHLRRGPSNIHKSHPRIHFANCSQLNKKKSRGAVQLETISKFAQTQLKNLNNGAGSNTKRD